MDEDTVRKQLIQQESIIESVLEDQPDVEGIIDVIEEYNAGDDPFDFLTGRARDKVVYAVAFITGVAAERTQGDIKKLFIEEGL